MGTSGDNPEKADVYLHEVKHNDIFIVGTDGLWDNLYLPNLLDLMRPFVRRGDNIVDPELVTEIICNEAEKLSKQQGYMSPFAKEAARYNQDYVGGKPNDITVILG